MKKALFIWIFICCFFTVNAQRAAFSEAAFSGRNTNLAGSRMSAQKTIIENLGSTGENSGLIMAIQSADLIELLQKEGPYTFFVPTDESFNKFMNQHMNSSDGDQKKLNQLLKNHIVSGRFDAATLSKMLKDADGNATITSLGGATLKFTKKGKRIILMDGQGQQSVIMSPDLEQRNGLIHMIDKVLSF